MNESQNNSLADSTHSLLIAGVVVVSLLTIVTLSGSVLVILAVVKFKRLQIPSNYILVNLATADISVAAFMPFLLASTLFESNAYLCLLPYSLVTVGFGVSLLSIGVIAYDRYAALVKPLKYYQHITTKWVVGFSAAIWLYVSIIAFTPFGWYYIEHNRVDKNEDQIKCSFKLLNKYVVLFQVVVLFVPVFIIMIGCYCHVMLVARHHSRAISAIQLSLFPNSFSKNFQMFKGNKYSRTLLIILGFFFLTWVSFTVALLVEKFCDVCGDRPLHKYSSFLLFANSCLNPWIYAHRNQDFKAAFCRLGRAFICKKKKPRSGQGCDGRQNSRFSDALSRTNSMVGGLQHLHILYDNADIVPSTVETTKTSVAPKLIQHDKPKPKPKPKPVDEMQLQCVSDVEV